MLAWAPPSARNQAFSPSCALSVRSQTLTVRVWAEPTQSDTLECSKKGDISITETHNTTDSYSLDLTKRPGLCVCKRESLILLNLHIPLRGCNFPHPSSFYPLFHSEQLLNKIILAQRPTKFPHALCVCSNVHKTIWTYAFRERASNYNVWLSNYLPKFFLSMMYYCIWGRLYGFAQLVGRWDRRVDKCTHVTSPH